MSKSDSTYVIYFVLLSIYIMTNVSNCNHIQGNSAFHLDASNGFIPPLPPLVALTLWGNKGNTR